MHYIFSWVFILYLFLPTFIANWAPIVAKNIPLIGRFKTPISEKYFGKNKTYRGFIVGVITAILVSLLQYYLSDLLFVETVKIKYFAVISSLYLAFLCGFLQGFWALVGDAVKSFFKRRVGIKPGEPWPVLDGIDYIVWSVVFFYPIFFPSIIGIIFLCCVWPIASLLANMGAYVVKWKDVRY